MLTKKKYFPQKKQQHTVPNISYTLTQAPDHDKITISTILLLHALCTLPFLGEHPERKGGYIIFTCLKNKYI